MNRKTESAANDSLQTRDPKSNSKAAIGESKAISAFSKVSPQASQSAASTPMMEQYFKIKAENADFLLFYRMGDFYELFFDDALIAAKALDITLTARGKHNGADIPMCGVPVHAAEDYLQKLIAADYRIAVCEQMEDPAAARARGAKSVVRREVVRLVTPGTITEEKLLAPGRGNYLMALVRHKNRTPAQFSAPQPAQQDLLLTDGAYCPEKPFADTKQPTASVEYALAWVDISTGVFRVSSCDETQVLADILRIDPQELLLAESLCSDEKLRPLLRIIGKAVSPQPESLFAGTQAEKRICSYYNIAAVESFADFSKTEMRAAAAVLAYVEKTQIHEKPSLQRPARQDAGRHILIDAATAANLELIRTQSGKSEGSLLKAINRTLTGSGTRLLAERLSMPLNQAEAIGDRLDSVGFFLAESHYRIDLREKLTGLADSMRALQRLALARGGPRDFAVILHALETAAAVCHSFSLADLPHELHCARQALEDMPQAWRQKLQAALADDLPLLKRDGGFIRKGYHAELDELRSLKTETHRVIAAMQNALAAETGIKNLKIKHNNILGFFIEVATAQAAPFSETDAAKSRFIHRQSLANAMRFTTTELADLETRINTAANGALAIELQIFEDLTQDLKLYAEDLREGAAALAVLDVSAALAVLAEEQAYCRPSIDTSLQLNIKGGRHPVVEQALRAQADDPFIANDCDLSPSAAMHTAAGRTTADISAASHADADNAGGIWLLTGPNMGGKSTFLRQNALIVLLAQMGSFVPAEEAHIGLVDRVFSRVGASDDLARGRSTFMVEMVETATILNQATEKSLVILDEIGRGTATFDGLSIAWAALEYLHNKNRCRAVFATHFHELTVLTNSLPRLSNHTMKVSEWNGDVIFLHEVGNGVADRSYGVQVAQLAGLPEAVVARARDVLAQLENKPATAHTAAILQGLSLFGDAAKQSAPANSPHTARTNGAEQDNGKQTGIIINGEALSAASPFNAASAEQNSDRVPAPLRESAQQSAPYAMPKAQETSLPAQLLQNLESLRQAVSKLDPDSLTPRAALDELYRLKALLKVL